MPIDVPVCSVDEVEAQLRVELVGDEVDGEWVSICRFYVDGYGRSRPEEIVRLPADAVSGLVSALREVLR